MEELIKRVIEFRDARDWKKFHTPENLAKSISIESGELLENFQWNSSFSQEKVFEELADVFIYCILLADSLDINLIEKAYEKLKKNDEKYPVEKSKGNSKKYTEL
ncbi:MAG: nucleotide pyrophosphohydrolase [Acutalibacteraceae bacterium]|jgi:NTP pyrophosphatase (non-canonical NTP hydrolase)